MLRSDWSSSPSLPPLPSLSGTATPLVRSPALPQAPGSASAAYTPLGQEVARDVQRFIAQGGASGSVAAFTTPQASWLALQAARQAGGLSKTNVQRDVRGGKADAASSAQDKAATALRPEQQAFLNRIGPWAEQAARHLGVSSRAVLAHAALESGWGQRSLRNAAGEDSLNLFGIKAFGGWKGASVQAQTTEFENGQFVAQAQPFREYADLDATFSDYVRLLSHSPRYRAALRTGDDMQAFAGALAQGGYATDPDYAQKLLRVSRQIP